MTFKTPDEISFHKYLTGEISSEESQFIDDWRAKHPENERAFAEFQALWQETETGELGFDTQKGWQDLSQRLAFEEKQPTNLIIFRRIPAGVFATAAALLLVFAGLRLINTKPPAPDQEVLVTGQGEVRSLRLPEGSVVTLNANSSLRYSAGLAGENREITLDGQAFFEVASDGRPFIVFTDQVQVEVLGTRFDVRETQAQTRVVVEEGKVRFASRGQPEKAVLLTQGMTSSCDIGGIPTPVQYVTVETLLSWREKKHQFQSEKLADVIDVLARYYGETIQLDEPQLGELKVTASFENETLANILTEIALTLGLEYLYKDKVHLIRNQS